MESELVLELPNDPRHIEHAIDSVMECCTACQGFRREIRLNLRVSLTEALSNAMLYGNGRDPEKRVRVEVVVREWEIEARITDQGVGFNPRGIPDPTAPDNLEKSRGRGLFLMRELMDEVYFNEQGNEVTLILRLEPGGGSHGTGGASV